MIPALPSLLHRGSGSSVSKWSLNNPIFIGQLNTTFDIHDYTISPDGVYLYTTSENDKTTRQYQLLTPHIISTATDTGRIFNNGLLRPRGLTFKPDGTVMYILDYNTDGNGAVRIYQYNLTTPWMVDTAVYANLFGAPGGYSMSPRFKSDGNTLYAGYVGIVGAPARIYQHSTSGWDVSTILQQSFANFGTPSMGSPITFKLDDTRIMFVRSGNVRLYSMTPGDITSAVEIQSFNPSNEMSLLVGVHVSDNGDYMYLYEGDTLRTIYQYAL